MITSSSTTFDNSSVHFAGCADTQRSEPPKPSEEQPMRRLPMPTSAPVISFDLSTLTMDDMRLGDDFIGSADLAVERRSDGEKNYAYITFEPQPGMSDWITTIVGLPRTEFIHGIEWIELEVWNPGVPVKVVVDGTDQQTECFEIAFCENDTVWKGWRTFTVPLSTERPREHGVSLDGAVQPPIRIKWLIVIMRQGLPWQLGFRQLRIKPLKDTTAQTGG